MSRYFKKAHWYDLKREFHRARYALLIHDIRRYRDEARANGFNGCADMYVFKAKCLVQEAKLYGL